MAGGVCGRGHVQQGACMVWVCMVGVCMAGGMHSRGCMCGRELA